jgi:asparagine synthase (glutamine-hydrolysing)
MCGISGVVDADVNFTVNINILKEILGQIEHRGRPETLAEMDLFNGFGTCLGTNRLPIVNPDGNKQPAVSSCQNIALIMNAQIFNFKELSIKYNLDGLIKSKSGDTHFLAEFIEKYGVDFALTEINWEGSFIYLDMKSNEIVFVRDHLGIKPLYYTIVDGKLLFSSEIKGFKNIACEEICTVLPGTINSYSLERREIITKKWWNLSASSEDDNLMNILRSAVEIRVPQEPYAVLLSGGLDSSIILSLAKKVHDNITAYTLYTDESPDLPYARKLCKELNIPLVEVNADSSDVLRKKIPKIVEIVEAWEWQVINHSAPMDVLFEKIREDGHKVILTGEGADELFFGYEDTNILDANKSEKERERRILDLHRTNCRRLDRMSMAYGLECRVPFLDRRLVSLSLNYSYDDCVSETRNKIPLRDIGEAILPEGFSNRKKLSLSKGVGYKYGKNQNMKNVFGADDEFPSEMRNKKFEKLARFPIEKYLIDVAAENGYFKAKYLLEAGT